MNAEYDTTKACTMLEDIRREDEARSEGNKAIENDSLSHAKFHSVKLVEFKYPPSTRMMDGETEVVLKMRGVLCGKLLPPFNEIPAGMNTLSRIRSLRQHVKITGLGSDEFEGYQTKLQDVHERFVEHAADRTVQPFDFIPYEGHPTLDSHSRYFTDRNMVPYEKNLPFLPGVDPRRVLRKLQPEEFIHGPDNVVEYCVRAIGSKGLPCYTPCDPSMFRVGDIVEVAFSCVGIPIKGQCMRVLLQLRGLTLIDNTIRREAERADSFTVPLAALCRTPKRKTLYLSKAEVDINKPSKAKRQRGVEEATDALDDSTYEGQRKRTHDGEPAPLYTEVSHVLSTSTEEEGEISEELGVGVGAGEGGKDLSAVYGGAAALPFREGGGGIGDDEETEEMVGDGDAEDGTLAGEDGEGGGDEGTMDDSGASDEEEDGAGGEDEDQTLGAELEDGLFGEEGTEAMIVD